MKLFSIFLGLAASAGALACDFQFDGVVNRESEGKAFSLIRNYLDKNGETRTIKSVVVPLNEETQRSLVKIANDGTSVCLYGTYSSVNPRQYFVYRAE